MTRLEGLIPAAGKGVRARPYTSEMHKGMLHIDGKPNIERIIRLMRDEMDITNITIVVGHLGNTIRDYFGDGSRFGVNLKYIGNDKLEKGMAYSVYLGHKTITGPFCMMLCDECYFGSNHASLRSYPMEDVFAVCAGQRVDDQSLIKKNYAVYMKDNRFTRLVEKPQRIETDIMGSGTFLFSPRLFPLLKEAFDRSESGYVEFVNFIGSLIETGERVDYFELEGTYVNINDRDSLLLAQYHERNRCFNKKNIGLLIYAEGDEQNVAFTVDRYLEIPEIREVCLVVPARNNVEEQVAGRNVRIIKCPEGFSLYGEKLKYAMKQMDSDIIVLTEAEYSFAARDISKLLIYLREADMVVGTRTTRELIEQGSDMRGSVRLANIFLGKLLEMLWWNREVRLTDIGCTFRAVWRSSLERVFDRLAARGPEFSAEMMIEMLQDRQRVIEIPVNYFNRGLSLARAYQNPATAIRFLSLIITRRMRYFLRAGTATKK